MLFVHSISILKKWSNCPLYMCSLLSVSQTSIKLFCKVSQGFRERQVMSRSHHFPTLDPPQMSVPVVWPQGHWPHLVQEASLAHPGSFLISPWQFLWCHQDGNTLTGPKNVREHLGVRPFSTLMFLSLLCTSELLGETLKILILRLNLRLI